MIRLNEVEKLWRYLPLPFLFWVYLFLSFSLAGIRNISGNKSRHFLLASLAGILLGISFPPLPFLPLLIPAWMLIIYLTDETGTNSIGYRFRLFFHVFILWNIVATYWISNTAFFAGIAAFVTNSMLMCVPIILYTMLKKGIPIKFRFVLFAACWLSFEYFHFRWEAHWPWLAMGHYFMEVPWLIQWYEYTGILGGSLWVLAISWLSYVCWQRVITTKQLILSIVLLALPVVISLILSSSPDLVNENKIDVVIVQPNYEPHYVKGRIPQREEVQHFLSLAAQQVDENTDYLIFPETSFSININNWAASVPVRELKLYLSQHPHLTLVSGLETNYILTPEDKHDQYTRTHIRNRDTIYWENHNSAVRMSASQEKEIYYKSKLVPGAEFFPFKKSLFFLKPLMDKLGGSGSGLRKQPERSAFEGVDGHKVAPVICYESVYGEYVNGYFDKGAEWIAVMTNDGWWDKTGGHRQHLGLSVLRAIEQRKWVARAANSGVSCFIDPKGHVLQPTAYGVEDAIRGAVVPNQNRTFYSRVGDIIGRVSLLLIFGVLLASVSQIMRRRREKSKKIPKA